MKGRARLRKRDALALGTRHRRPAARSRTPPGEIDPRGTSGTSARRTSRRSTSKWSDDHLKVIAKIEQAVLDGGLFAMAMPRSGKTSLCEIACLWALLYGHREFVAARRLGRRARGGDAGLDQGGAGEQRDPGGGLPGGLPSRSARSKASTSGLRGSSTKAKQTHIGWTAREIVLPTIPAPARRGDHPCRRITGRIRGMKHKACRRRQRPPSLVLIDDPQTDESETGRHHAVRQPRADPRRARSWPGGPAEDRRAPHDADGGPPRRPGRPHPRPGQAPAVAGRTNQDGLSFPTCRPAVAEYARIRPRGSGRPGH